VVSHRPRLITDDLVQMRLAALRGVGVAQLPAFAVDDDLTAGALVEVVPRWAPKAGVVHTIFPSRRGLLPAVRGLLDYLVEAFAEIPRSDAASSVVIQRKGQHS
jgi:DNA-binding transcriptional LysR family regulator